jgi:hypothetical protein
MYCRRRANECRWQTIESEAANEVLLPLFAAHIWAVPCQGQSVTPYAWSLTTLDARIAFSPRARQIVEGVAPRLCAIAEPVADFQEFVHPDGLAHVMLYGSHGELQWLPRLVAPQYTQ